jgi:hypothetical protein
MRFARGSQFSDMKAANLSREFLTEVNFKRVRFVDDLASGRISGKR